MKLIIVLGSVLALVACVSPAERVIVDTRNVDMTKYQAHQKECTEFVKQVPVGKEVVKGMLIAGAAGAALGGIFGSWGGEAGRAAATGAGTGIVAAGLPKAEEGWREQRRVMKNCLERRGYVVLN